VIRLVHIFGFSSFKIKDYACFSVNKDIFNYGNRKSDSIWVQIESLLAERVKRKTTWETHLQKYFEF